MQLITDILLSIGYFSSKVVFIISLYYVVMSIFGLYKGKKKADSVPTKRFALIIAAHNEEMVIKYSIDSLKKLDYPEELYDIFLIADNCDDKTAEIGEKSGALVFERKSIDKRGKGYALEWMFAKLFKMEKQYDAVAIFDADNLVSRNFLKEMNNKLCEGYSAVQGYLDSKNPNDSWITGGYSIGFWQANRMMQLAKSNLNFSNQIGGTGFCITVDTLKKFGWGATCLTEDLEFTCKLILNGEKVGWAHDALIYDEKPITLKQSWNQRKRWMQGYADVASRYFFELVKKGIKKRSWTMLDCALYSIQPYFTILIGISTLFIFRNYINAFIFDNLNKVFDISSVPSMIFTIASLIVAILYTPFVLWLDKKLTLKTMLWYVLYPIYTLTWVPISIQGIIDRNKKEWSHTSHTRSVEISELEKI
ncbi:glycosyltransferase family 2 protein [Clostridium cellulovorans]|uniref:Glycosyl transferase family 2 n=1 Tax=Clostridium cellulovorans (strain ATCC 35296 / DSM 3052 / OCM 3 / 743B) TaxID=573061 RepID=D9SL72_CLOC7|nr:glycosyltransferase family 2 protein [Clostridium cellulovorans]ADL51588.1 glycosyl transferase family 2 [Clostridium cellulovorans 743B]